jgi:hypothetical protein
MVFFIFSSSILFGHIKGNRSFRKWSLRGLAKVHESQKRKAKKAGRKNWSFFRPAFILGTYWTAPF